MRTDIILDLGLYFIKNTSGIKNKERLNDFIVFSEILKLQRFQDSLTDSEYYIKNNKIMVLSQPDVVNDLLSKSIPNNRDLDVFSDEFYYCVLKQTELSEENITYVIDRIKHFQYIYNTFAV